MSEYAEFRKQETLSFNEVAQLKKVVVEMSLGDGRMSDSYLQERYGAFDQGVVLYHALNYIVIAIFIFARKAQKSPLSLVRYFKLSLCDGEAESDDEKIRGLEGTVGQKHAFARYSDAPDRLDHLLKNTLVPLRYMGDRFFVIALVMMCLVILIS